MLQGSPLSGAEVPVTTICVCTCTAVLTYSALSDPHSHCKQCFPRLDGPRGKHPWQGLSIQTGLALTSRLRAGIRRNISLKHLNLPKNHFKSNLFFVQPKHLNSTFTFGEKNENMPPPLLSKSPHFDMWFLARATSLYKSLVSVCVSVCLSQIFGTE